MYEREERKERFCQIVDMRLQSQASQMMPGQHQQSL